MKVIHLVLTGLPITGAVLASHNDVAGSYPHDGILKKVKAIQPKMHAVMDAIPIVLEGKHESEVAKTMQRYIDAYNAKHMNAMEQLSNAISTERAAKTYLKEVEGVLPHGLPENTVLSMVFPEIYALLNKAYHVTPKDIIRLELGVDVQKGELDIMFSEVKASLRRILEEARFYHTLEIDDIRIRVALLLSDVLDKQDLQRKAIAKILPVDVLEWTSKPKYHEIKKRANIDSPVDDSEATVTVTITPITASCTDDICYSTVETISTSTSLVTLSSEYVTTVPCESYVYALPTPTTFSVSSSLSVDSSTITPMPTLPPSVSTGVDTITSKPLPSSTTTKKGNNADTVVPSHTLSLATAKPSVFTGAGCVINRGVMMNFVAFVVAVNAVVFHN